MKNSKTTIKELNAMYRKVLLHCLAITLGLVVCAGSANATTNVVVGGTYDSGAGTVTGGAQTDLDTVYGSQTAVTENTTRISNILDGSLTVGQATTLKDSTGALSASVAELNYVDGVTSNIQDQLNTNAGAIGTLGNLTTDADSNLVAAINEVDAHADTNATAIGNISTFSANDYAKGASVAVAVNALDDQVKANADAITILNGDASTTGSVAKAISDNNQTITTTITGLIDTKSENLSKQFGYDVSASSGVDADPAPTGNLNAQYATTTTYLTGAQTLVAADKALDAAVKANADDIGTLGNLTTTAKSNLVAAINEVDAHADTNATAIGTLGNLTTDADSNLVAAINEVDAHADTNAGAIGVLNADVGTTGSVLNSIKNNAENAKISSWNSTESTINAVLGSGNYASNNVVQDGNDLTTAIGSLDAFIGDKSAVPTALGTTITGAIGALDTNKANLSGATFTGDVNVGSNISFVEDTGAITATTLTTTGNATVGAGLTVAGDTTLNGNLAFGATGQKVNAISTSAITDGVGSDTTLATTSAVAKVVGDTTQFTGGNYVGSSTTTADAVMALDGQVKTNADAIGTLDDLTTSDKTDLVSAINELDEDTADIVAESNRQAGILDGSVYDLATNTLTTPGTALNTGNGANVVASVNAIGALLNDSGADTLTNQGGFIDSTKSIVTNINSMADKVAVDGGRITTLETTMLTTDGVQTLSNKTIDATANTISNLAVSNFATGVVVNDVSSSATDNQLATAKAVYDEVNALATGAVATNTADIATNTADIATNTAAIGDISTFSANDYAKGASVAVAVNALDDQVKTNAGDIATNTASIATLNSGVGVGGSVLNSIYNEAEEAKISDWNNSTSAIKTVLGDGDYASNNILQDGNDLTNAMSSLDAAIGDISTFSANDYAKGANVAVAVNALDDQVKTNADKIATNTADIATNTANIGDISTFSANDYAKGASVAVAVNALDDQVKTNADAIGTLTNLTTTAQTDLVSAINEVDGDIATLNSGVGVDGSVLNSIYNNAEEAKISDWNNSTSTIKTVLGDGDYASNNVVQDGNDLTNAIGSLDAFIGVKSAIPAALGTTITGAIGALDTNKANLSGATFTGDVNVGSNISFVEDTGAITATTLTTTGNASVGADLTVTGDTTLTGDLTVGDYITADAAEGTLTLQRTQGADVFKTEIETGSVTVSDGTNSSAVDGDGFTVYDNASGSGNVVSSIDTTGVFTQGTIIANGLAQFNGGIDVNGSKFTVDVSGNTTAQGNLVVAGLTNLNGATQINNTLAVAGDMTLNGNLAFGAGQKVNAISTSAITDGQGSDTTLATTSAVAKVVGNTAQFTSGNYVGSSTTTADAVMALDTNLNRVEGLVGSTTPRIERMDSDISRIDTDLNRLEKETKGGFAAAAAMAALVPNGRASGDTQISVGTGAYRGRGGLALGAFHYFNDNVLVNVGAAYAGSKSTTLKAGVTFGW